MIPGESVDLEASATQAPLAALILGGFCCAVCSRSYASCDCGPRVSRDDVDRAVLDREAGGSR